MIDAQTLIDKIRALPEERIAEVEDFVEFLATRERERLLTREATAVSAPAFTAIWANPDDAYDAAILSEGCRKILSAGDHFFEVGGWLGSDEGLHEHAPGGEDQICRESSDVLEEASA